MIAASCIMPTRNRRQFVGRSIELFLRQDAANLELLILDDGDDAVADCVPGDSRIRYIRRERRMSVGEKRNLLCAEARGAFIVHWDDDDWYPADRVGRQLEALRSGAADVCGTSKVYYHDPFTDRAWRYTYRGKGPYAVGNSLAYRRAFWEATRFANVQVGEDTRFVHAVPAGRLVDMKDPSLCVATIHSENVSPKRPRGSSWESVDSAAIRALLQQSSAPQHPLGLNTQVPAVTAPLVSCIMSTGNRRAFVALSIELFEAQDYPSLELVVVDGGEDPVADICAHRPSVRYARVPRSTSIGARRNLACEQATGEIILHWDDDDWYGPDRVRLQVEPILAGRADITGLKNQHTLRLADQTFWSMSAPLHRRMFVGGVHGGTLAFRRKLFELGIRYPDVNLAEDAAFLRRAQQAGARLLPVENLGSFVYVRHGQNAWKFEPPSLFGAKGWLAAERPASMPAGLVLRYHDAQHIQGMHGAARPVATVSPASTECGSAALGLVDSLGATRMPTSGTVCDRCVAFVVSERYADMLDAALLSLAQLGDIADAYRVVLVVDRAPACEQVAARHGAEILRCAAVRPIGPAIKAALYALGHVVQARQYLCLDADVLIRKSLRGLFEEHSALAPGRVLIAAEASRVPFSGLGSALTSMYGATPDERARLTRSDHHLDSYPMVINDGVFVADRTALLSIDAALREAPEIADWVHARRDVWWRQKAALNLALARTQTATLLDGRYNVQLHVEKIVPADTKIVHFNGRGRRLFRAFQKTELNAIAARASDLVG